MLSSKLIVFVPTSLSTAITARASLERFILYVQFGVNLSRQHNYSFHRNEISKKNKKSIFGFMLSFILINFIVFTLFWKFWKFWKLINAHQSRF